VRAWKSSTKRPKANGSRCSGAAADGVARRRRSTHAREQFARVERLAEIVVGAELEADDAIDVVRACGEHDHGDVVAGRAQLAQRGQAVHAGHHQVQHDQVGALALEALFERRRVVQHGHFHPLPHEIVAQQVSEFLVVVDDEDLGSHGRKFSARARHERTGQTRERVTAGYRASQL
jgi:hypothetical protein